MPHNPNLLIFGRGNSKLSRSIYHVSLPSGWSCPGAKICFAKANQFTGKLTDGPKMKIRCFSASEEAVFPNVRNIRWHNFNLLEKCKTKAEMVALIEASLPKNAFFIRSGVAGDFYKQMYFDAWLEVIQNHPEIKFYAYTKSLPFWIARLNKIPSNFNLTASKGGKYDNLIPLYNLKFAEMVSSEEEAEKKQLEIDHDDSHAHTGRVSFALLIHGNGPKGSLQARMHSAVRHGKNPLDVK
jgi:hypothetical protein